MKQAGQNSMGNFWYYHKYQVLAGILIFLLLVYYLAEILRKKEPDYELALVSGQTISENFCTALEEGLQPYLKDSNGDGEVVVRVNSYYYGAEHEFLEEKDANRLMGGAVQLAADLEMGISMVYITDDSKALDHATEEGFRQEWLAWNDSNVLRNIKLPETANDQLTSEALTENLMVGIRKAEHEKGENLKRGLELWNLIKKE